jgi:hypothetical protein
VGPKQRQQESAQPKLRNKPNLFEGSPPQLKLGLPPCSTKHLFPAPFEKFPVFIDKGIWPQGIENGVILTGQCQAEERN